MVPKAPGGLPAEYLAVQYLESTGTQYIDTGYSPTNNTSVELDYSFSANVSGHNGLVGQDGSKLRIKAEIRYATRWYLSSPTRRTNYPTIFDGTGQSANVRYKLTLDENGITLNDLHADGLAQTTTLTNNIYLFALNSANEPYEIAKHLRVYSLKFYESGVLSYDIIPCIRISDSKPGMYDLVGRQFYTNQGTGEFIAGLAPDLSDTDFWSVHGYIRASGQVVLDENYRACEYQPIIGGNSYTLSMKDVGWFMIMYFDDTYSRVAYAEKSTQNSWTLAAPANTKYYRLYVEKTQTEVKFTMDN